MSGVPVIGRARAATVAVLLLLLPLLACAIAPVRVRVDAAAVELDNGFVRSVRGAPRCRRPSLSGRSSGGSADPASFVPCPLPTCCSIAFNRTAPQIDAAYGDVLGTGRYAGNVFAGAAAAQHDPAQLRRGGFLTESAVVTASGQRVLRASSAAVGGPHAQPSVTVLHNTSALGSVRIDGIVDDAGSPLVIESWTLSLAAGRRDALLSIRGTVQAGAAVSVRHALYLAAPSIYALFDRGVAQMMAMPEGHLVATNPLRRFYALGDGRCLATERSVDGLPYGRNETVLLSSGAWHGSGLLVSVAGTPLPVIDRWSTGDPWAQLAPTQLAAGTYAADWRLAPNSDNYPLLDVPPSATLLGQRDLAALLTGIYASPVGALASFDPQTPGEIGATIHAPTQGYHDLYNFFDPDNFIFQSALLYSGDAYLHNETRKVLERTISTQLATGQIAHHFSISTPIYVAISGATQTGPNLFWTLTALRYVIETGDMAWLRSNLERIRLAVQYLERMIDPTVGLMNVPGPLWIDVFIRSNYTSDSNAAAVLLLREVAQMELALGNTTRAASLLRTVDRIVSAMNRYLLLAPDHYVTDRSADLRTTRDFVDYDANLLAVALGIPPSDSVAERILARIDAGRCTHARATWVSEVYYGPRDCYHGNIGDSATTMGRIGWADALARRRMKQLDVFDRVILEPIIGDMLARVWLTERYNCKGESIRTPYYAEYPCVAAMLLREIRYGIRIGLNEVFIDPFGVTQFGWHPHRDGIHVDYRQQDVRLRFMAAVDAGARRAYRFCITGLLPNATYTVTVDDVVRAQPTDGAGVLRFSGLCRAGPCLVHAAVAV